MFDYRHYIPILRWKRGERIALRNLQGDIKAQMTPLVELIPGDFKTGNAAAVDNKLYKIAEDLFKNWGQAPLFVDLGLLYPAVRASNGLHPIEVLCREAHIRQLSLIPVTGLDRTESYLSAVASIIKEDHRGACIRLRRPDIQRPTFLTDLGRLLTQLELSPPHVHLLVDYQIINNSCPSFANLCSLLPNLSQWRTFTIASGAFTKDLSGFGKNRQHIHTRLDWLTWHGQIASSPPLPRPPSYSDYTIQYPIFEEIPSFPNISASIRYTAEEYWVIMRGEGLRNEDGPGFAQYPANAQLLCDRPEFCGAGFSYGDAYIEEMGRQSEKTGTPETWIRAGINHHLTFVVRQIANLSGVSTVDTP